LITGDATGPVIANTSRICRWSGERSWCERRDVPFGMEAHHDLPAALLELGSAQSCLLRQFDDLQRASAPLFDGRGGRGGVAWLPVAGVGVGAMMKVLGNGVSSGQVQRDAKRGVHLRDLPGG
jgi:hypothetical protein